MRPRALPPLLAMAAAILLLVAPGAGAMTGGYASHAWAGCGGGYNSGTWDDAGRVYVPCGSPSVIGVYDESGARVQSIELDYRVSDVAPTRDGSRLYVATGQDIRRLARQADGSYAADASWRPVGYTSADGQVVASPSGHFVATDAAGRVYVADGAWSRNLAHAVVVYEPDGSLVSTFGRRSNSWATGVFYWQLGGLAVSDDGSRVLTVETGNNRIQQWHRSTGAGAVTYTAGATPFGSTEINDPDRAGACTGAAWAGRFAAPYDVAFDGAGNVYVINTTCEQVLSFDGPLTALRAVVNLGPIAQPLPHGFAVGRDGTVYVGESERVLRPAGGTIPANGSPAVRTPPPAPTPTADPVVAGPTGGGPTVPPAPVGDPDPTTDVPTFDIQPPSVRLGRVVSSRTRRGRAVGVALRCNERCRVDVVVRQRGRTVGRRIAWVRPGRVTPLALRLTRRAGSGRTAVQIRVSDRAGNARRYGRITRLR